MSKRRVVSHLLMAAINGGLLLWILFGGAIGAPTGLGEGESRPAPPFRLADLTGAERDLKDFAGEVLLIDFWATWCEPCVKALPHLDELAAEFGEGKFRVVAITVDDADDLPEIKKVLAEKKLSHLLVLLDPMSDTSEAFGVGQMPTSYLVDRQQRIIKVYSGVPEDPKELHFDIMEAVVK